MAVYINGGDVTDFFLRDGDEQRAEGAVHLDDLDLVYSKHEIGPWGPILVSVAVKHGMHVCWRCGEPFDENGKRELRPQEVKTGYATILLHAGCVNRRLLSVRSYHDIIRGLQARRFYAKATQSLDNVLKGAGSDTKDKASGG